MNKRVIVNKVSVCLCIYFIVMLIFMIIVLNMMRVVEIKRRLICVIRMAYPRRVFVLVLNLNWKHNQFLLKSKE